MLKNLMIGAAFIEMAAGPAGAQHLEATLQKVEVPASSFDIVFATAKPGGWTFDPGTQRDAYSGVSFTLAIGWSIR